ncbi:MAG: CCA tRNA nucleotidyltransferase, partial [Gemmatimonadales bacterium]
KTDGRHAGVVFGVDLEQDLARRDFTINAIAYHPLRHAWRDPFDGQGDLERKLVRAVGDAAERFREDYLRILRALRFAGRFGFEIDPATWEAAKANAGGLEHLSAERVREEWFRGLETSRRPSELLRLWCEIGAVELWMREVRCAQYVVRGKQGAGHGAQEGATTVIDRLGGSDPVLLTAYLSDDPGATLARLKCSTAEIERGREIGRMRDTWPDPASRAAVRRWMSEALDVVDDLLAIRIAEGKDGELARAVAETRAAKAPLRVGDLAVNGDDLIAAGIPEGPEIGNTLRRLLDEVLEDPQLNTKDRLLRSIPEASTRRTAHSAQGSAHSPQRGRGGGARKRK